MERKIMTHDKYEAFILGSAWAAGPTGTFGTIRAAREWAESYGTTADGCLIQRSYKRRVRQTVALHKRDTSGDGTRWYRAAV